MSHSSLVDTRASSEMTAPWIKPAEAEERDGKLDGPDTLVRSAARAEGL